TIRRAEGSRGAMPYQLLIGSQPLPSGCQLRQGPMTDSNDRYVKTGVFLAPFHPVRENPLLSLERDMDLLVHLDRLNYHEAWIGEHHSAGFQIISCRKVFLPVAP